MNSNNCFSKGTPKKFKLESINRLMEDLSRMDDHDQYINNIFVKEEPVDFSYLDEITQFKQEENVEYDELTCEIPIKQELDEVTFVGHRNILPEDLVELPLRFVTEVIIKKEGEDLDYQFLSCLEDLKHKNLRIVLKRFKCFMCDHCPLFYKTKKTLARHIHSKHFLLFYNTNNVSKLRLSCKICNKKLSYKSWHEHMSIVHSVKKFMCKLCLKVFKHERYLKKHVLRIHKKRKPKHLLSYSPSECPLCLKMFSNKHALHTHNKTCHSEQTYTCKVCNSTLKCKTYLNAHMLRVHYDDGKMHVCDICTKKFKSPRYLKIHKKNSHYSL
ncbi:gastrula zinc finger protein XlCGF46.1-like isoform X2 [Aricia agestis]|uniref:gastrula zinc finger protein XlCGF46.1-like isoform X2 n=1 Tax=Aricia agestis TaxID=91739 RepID=UPI001C209AF0|nr:gastrula zinc finger protein XlCGF46.1-like isoform X2 [Aricia agestis]